MQSIYRCMSQFWTGTRGNFQGEKSARGEFRKGDSIELSSFRFWLIEKDRFADFYREKYWPKTLNTSRRFEIKNRRSHRYQSPQGSKWFIWAMFRDQLMMTSGGLLRIRTEDRYLLTRELRRGYPYVALIHLEYYSSVKDIIDLDESNKLYGRGQTIFAVILFISLRIHGGYTSRSDSIFRDFHDRIRQYNLSWCFCVCILICTAYHSNRYSKSDEANSQFIKVRKKLFILL